MRWTSDLAVGVKEIDDQHKIWFKKAGQLFEAGKDRRAKEVIGELLQFLDEYTKMHFADEEKFMREINYPGYAEQKKAHSEFIQRLKKLRQDYEASGGSITVIIQANKMVVNWLIGHISRMDRKIGEFVKSQK
ncbi:MAG: hemerythrin family protein [Firmicutes bacterium]|nr:hemerythrin family protein [Bacillota bacterium]